MVLTPVTDFRKNLLEIWDRAHDLMNDLPCTAEEFSTWSGATKDILTSMGMEWDVKIEEYVFQNQIGEPCIKCGRVLGRPIHADYSLGPCCSICGLSLGKVCKRPVQPLDGLGREAMDRYMVQEQDGSLHPKTVAELDKEIDDTTTNTGTGSNTI